MTKQSSPPLFAFRDLSNMPYQKAWDLQKSLHGEVLNGTQPDTLLFVEHEPVYTLGKNADENHILQQKPGEIKTYHIERGGDVTYHGPGQLVGYPIFNLKHYQPSVSWYMRTLEEILIRSLAAFDISAGRKDGLTGVWVADEKIAALGVRVSRWVTMHGFALNVSTDLSFYSGIIPCGIFEYGVTSMENILGQTVDMEAVKQDVRHHFEDLFTHASTHNFETATHT